MPTGATIDELPGFHEPFSSISHLLGAAVFLGLGCLLLRRGRGSTRRLIFLGIYVASCVLLLSMSGVYHMLGPGDGRQVLARLDHGAIFIFIAGTFTPVHGILFRGWLRWGPLFLIWGAAITAITFTTIFYAELPYWFGLICYLTLGWQGVASGTLLAYRYSFAFIKPLVLGGVAYSVGAITDYCRWPVIIPGVIHEHEVFHLAVLLGALYHGLFVWQIARGADSLRHRERVKTDQGRLS
jgi:channel protein (hemolysin III family)